MNEGVRTDEKITKDELSPCQCLAAPGTDHLELVAAGTAGEAVPPVFSRVFSPARPCDVQGFLTRRDKSYPRLREEFLEHLFRGETGRQFGEDRLAEHERSARKVSFEKPFR